MSRGSRIYHCHLCPSTCRLATLFLERGPNRIGSLYKKAVYRHYTDNTYSTEIPKPAWLGFLGPVLRAEVGDVLLIHLKNFASRPYSLHPHGVFYNKDSEGNCLEAGAVGVLGASWETAWRGCFVGALGALCPGPLLLSLLGSSLSFLLLIGTCRLAPMVTPWGSRLLPFFHW